MPAHKTRRVAIGKTNIASIEEFRKNYYGKGQPTSFDNAARVLIHFGLQHFGRRL